MRAFAGNLSPTLYRILRRGALEGFGRTLPAFTYRGELIYPELESEHAAYAYVKQNGEPVHSLHHAMNSKVKRSADFFVETCIVCHRSTRSAPELMVRG